MHHSAPMALPEATIRFEIQSTCDFESMDQVEFAGSLSLASSQLDLPDIHPSPSLFHPRPHRRTFQPQGTPGPLHHHPRSFPHPIRRPGEHCSLVRRGPLVSYQAEEPDGGERLLCQRLCRADRVPQVFSPKKSSRRRPRRNRRPRRHRCGWRDVDNVVERSLETLRCRRREWNVAVDPVWARWYSSSIEAKCARLSPSLKPLTPSTRVSTSVPR
jgi:hypothetical protein